MPVDDLNWPTERSAQIPHSQRDSAPALGSIGGPLPDGWSVSVVLVPTRVSLALDELVQTQTQGE